MFRIVLGIEYDGSHFSGWQYQQSQRTIQDVLEKALSRVADQTIKVHCAGRTDSGVHALEQVVHFNTEVERELKSWLMGEMLIYPRMSVSFGVNTQLMIFMPVLVR